MAAPIADDADIQKFDTLFANWQKQNPGKRFSDFSAHQIIRHLSLGRTHASLGTNLNSGKSWMADGEKPFRALCDF